MNTNENERRIKMGIEKSPIQKPMKQYIDQVLYALKTFYQDGLKVAELYTEMITIYPNAREQIRQAAEKEGLSFGTRFFNMLEDAGCHRMHWRLLPGHAEGNAAHIRQLPYSDQEEIFKGKHYPLLLADGDKLMVDVRKISRQQTKQIFGRGYIRDLAEQKSYLADNPAESKPPKETKNPWIVTKKGLRVGDILITPVQLRGIVIQMGLR
jgi:hypothetical protein